MKRVPTIKKIDRTSQFVQKLIHETEFLNLIKKKNEKKKITSKELISKLFGKSDQDLEEIIENQNFKSQNSLEGFVSEEDKFDLNSINEKNNEHNSENNDASIKRVDSIM